MVLSAVICPGSAALEFSGVDGIYGAKNGNKQACPARDVLHEITYILLVVRVVRCVRHPEINYCGYSVWPGMVELLDFVDPEGEVYISDA
jgi:hypothetical protein